MGRVGSDTLHGRMFDPVCGLQNTHKAGDIVWQIGQGKDAIKVLFLTPRGDVSFWNGFMTVVPMVLGSALCMILVRLRQNLPARQLLQNIFPLECNPLSLPQWPASR